MTHLLPRGYFHTQNEMIVVNIAEIIQINRQMDSQINGQGKTITYPSQLHILLFARKWQIFVTLQAAMGWYIFGVIEFTGINQWKAETNPLKLITSQPDKNNLVLMLLERL